MRKYLIDEDMLKDLLTKAYMYEILESGGVANWPDYMSNYANYVLHFASQLPKNEGVAPEELAAKLDEYEYSLDDLIDDEIKAFWSPYHERCGKECQFKFKAKPTKPVVDNH